MTGKYEGIQRTDGRKPYHAPTLLHYGDARDLTKAQSGFGADGGGDDTGSDDSSST